MAYPFCHRTKELEATEAADAFFYISFGTERVEKMLIFFFESHMILLERIISMRKLGIALQAFRQRYLTVSQAQFIRHYHHSDCSVL